MNQESIVLRGQIKQYKGDGRKLGYPTANIDAQANLEDGVYFGFADMGDYSHHPALIFIGVPTTMGEVKRRVEVYMLDIPDKDYYGLHLSVSPQYFYRANQTFDNTDELVSAMHEDEQAARQWFSTQS